MPDWCNWVYFPCWCLPSKPSHVHLNLCSLQLPGCSHATHLRPCTELQPHQHQAEIWTTYSSGRLKQRDPLKGARVCKATTGISHLFCFRTLSATERIYMCVAVLFIVSLGHVTQYTMKGISNSLREQPETKVRRSRGQPVPAMTSGQQPAVERAATGTKRTK